MTTDAVPARTAARTVLRYAAAFLVCSSAVLLFAVHVRPLAYLPLVLGVLLGLWIDRELGTDLVLIAVGLGIISTISLAADLSNAGMLRFTLALGGAVLVPWVLARYVVRHDAVKFPVATGRRWGRGQWAYLAIVVAVGYLVLPFYFLGSGAYLNWPDLDGAQDVWRLFVGVNAVGIWDELFFVCVCFALLCRHFPVAHANVLQSMIFVSFLWELGYREWGPLLTVPFALVQGWIFARFKSLPYVVTVHLLFDAVVFAVLVHGHRPDLFDIFLTAP
ncbi:CPBP family intramembrane metalloprotease [Myceligenerans sp. I2]|uniref:CPBP family intramembrane metalloprotease n=1 Tax=Myceligenerans indicum TaxID=2593663 RepID=A0ABS1LNL7_9MICO|nr:CPBP family intramembrane glutamic endopeptidase [Myceligenerans indicum]MBL0887825.1 CPBP family intramembrane metalloprotease [Myceligenerans indicum]